ncbi:MAG: hypothetical protein AAF708_22075 [Deinococcota bacterium]
MPKPKDIQAVDNTVVDASKVDASKVDVSEDANEPVVCGAPTPELARHIPNEETLKAIQDVIEGRDLECISFEDFKKELLGK